MRRSCPFGDSGGRSTRSGISTARRLTTRQTSSRAAAVPARFAWRWLSWQFHVASPGLRQRAILRVVRPPERETLGRDLQWGRRSTLPQHSDSRAASGPFVSGREEIRGGAALVPRSALPRRSANGGLRRSLALPGATHRAARQLCPNWSRCSACHREEEASAHRIDLPLARLPVLSGVPTGRRPDRPDCNSIRRSRRARCTSRC
jgi:hypothetical protein